MRRPATHSSEPVLGTPDLFDRAQPFLPAVSSLGDAFRWVMDSVNYRLLALDHNPVFLRPV
jgi:hypothetical protein